MFFRYDIASVNLFNLILHRIPLESLNSWKKKKKETTSDRWIHIFSILIYIKNKNTGKNFLYFCYKKTYSAKTAPEWKRTSSTLRVDLSALGFVFSDLFPLRVRHFVGGLNLFKKFRRPIFRREFYRRFFRRLSCPPAFLRYMWV